MAALENDVFKLDKVTLTVVGSEPTHVPYMSIQDNIYSYGFVNGDDLKALAVSILRRFDTKEAEQKSHNTIKAKIAAFANELQGRPELMGMQIRKEILDTLRQLSAVD